MMMTGQEPERRDTMKTRTIAVAAALMLSAASLIPLAGAGAEAAVKAPTARNAAIVAQADDLIVTDVVDNADVVAAKVKTHHHYTTVTKRFQVKVGHVSSKTKVCLWSTDCRKACTMMRRLSADETLTVVAQSNGWYKVVDKNGATGFVVRSRVMVA